MLVVHVGLRLVSALGWYRVGFMFGAGRAQVSLRGLMLGCLNSGAQSKRIFNFRVPEFFIFGKQ